MTSNVTIAVVGGDLRQVYLANQLAIEGYEVYGMFFDKNVQLDNGVIRSSDLTHTLPLCNVVIFPLPITSDGVTLNAPFGLGKVFIDDCLDYISPSAIIYGGKAGKDIIQKAHFKNLEIVDYLEREEMAVLNSVATAEGAIELTMQELAVTIFSTRCTILGFGRIAKVLARLLTAFGAQVTVVARKYSDLAWIKIYGCEAVHISRLEEAIEHTDVIYNTVPSVLLTKDRLCCLEKDCLVMDLASKPGGVDFEAAKDLGVKVIWALSLPGKVAPVSAGTIIKDTIFNSLAEKEVI